MTILDLDWMEYPSYWHCDDINGEYVLDDEAPHFVKRSFENYQKQLLDIDKRTPRQIILFKKEVDWDSYWDTDFEVHENFSNDLFSNVMIPYNEYLILKENGIYQLLLNNCAGGLSDEKLENLMSLFVDIKDTVPITWDTLKEAQKYKSCIFYEEWRLT